MKKYLFLLSLAILAFLSGCEHDDVNTDEPIPQEVVKYAFDVYKVNIVVENNAPVVSKDNYLTCTIKVDGNNTFSNYTGAAQIRGRGNSTWLWYDKKPYRIKLNQSASILGLKSNRDWILLANYRDPTKLMNTFSFEVADWLGLPFPNHTRYVEVTLNGGYIGLYQLTEQVEQGGNRVNIDENDGILLCLDVDDGPAESPNATNNFWSSVFKLPVAVKHPSEPTSAKIEAIRLDFASLEQAINTYNYKVVDSLLDIPSFINTLILQEMIYNVEIDAPRSLFLFKDKGQKYVFGPAWDFDAGFDFDWGTMYTGHNYFAAQELVLGTDPANHKNGYSISNFFTQMFRNRQFVLQYKDRWNEVKDSIVSRAWNIVEKYRISDALARDFQRWPIDKNYTTETQRMKNWLTNRVNYLNTVVNNYPDYTPITFQDCGTMSVDVTMSHNLGYAQSVTVNIDQSTLLSKLGISADKLNSSTTIIVPLKTDGTVGENNTNGTFGGWFSSNNNPGSWSTGHVYIEINQNLFSWKCGLRAENGYCVVGDNHTVRMQYQYKDGSLTKTVTILVNFTIAT